MKVHERLETWKVAHDLVLQTYRLAWTFPAEEKYGLAAHMKRSAVSIPSNIAEGHARKSTKDFLRFLYQARGSLAELEYQFRLAHDLGFVKDKNVESVMERLLGKAGALSYRLIESLEKKEKENTRRTRRTK